MKEYKIYLDSAASSPICSEAVKEWTDLSINYGGNPSSLHEKGLKARGKLEELRSRAGDILGIPAKHIIFTSGATEANNTVIKNSKLKRIIISNIEHNSVEKSAVVMEQHGVKVDRINILKSGIIDMDHLAKLLEEPVDLVSIMLVNNETGVIQPVETAAQLVKSKWPDAAFHSDAVQGISKATWFKTMEHIDYISISAHKFHGPKGVGILIVNSPEKFSPFMTGGSHEKGRRAGTEALPAIGAMVTALEVTWSARTDEFFEKTELFYSKLKTLIPSMEINGSKEQKVPWIYNLSFPGIRGDAFARSLDASGVMVSTSSACASSNKGMSRILKIMKCDEKRGHIRFSFNHYLENDIYNDACERISQCFETLAL